MSQTTVIMHMLCANKEIFQSKVKYTFQRHALYYSHFFI